VGDVDEIVRVPFLECGPGSCGTLDETGCVGIFVFGEEFVGGECVVWFDGHVVAGVGGVVEGGWECEGAAEPGTEECIGVDSKHGDWGV